MTHTQVILLMLAAIFMLVWWVVSLTRECNKRVSDHVQTLNTMTKVIAHLEAELDEVRELLALK